MPREYSMTLSLYKFKIQHCILICHFYIRDKKRGAVSQARHRSSHKLLILLFLSPSLPVSPLSTALSVQKKLLRSSVGDAFSSCRRLSASFCGCRSHRPTFQSSRCLPPAFRNPNFAACPSYPGSSLQTVWSQCLRSVWAQCCCLCRCRGCCFLRDFRHRYCRRSFRKIWEHRAYFVKSNPFAAGQ